METRLPSMPSSNRRARAARSLGRTPSATDSAAGAAPASATRTSGSVEGSNPEADAERGQQHLERLGATVVAGAEGLVESGQDGADEADDQLGVLGAAAER